MSDNDEIIRKLNAIIAKKMEFVDFGYMEFIYSKLPYIPHFHYLVAKDETCFMAINLELQLFTVDDTQRKALDFLYDLIMSHIKDVTERGDFSQLIEDAKSDVMDKYWRKFHELEFIAAQKDFNNRKKTRVSYNIEIEEE